MANVGARRGVAWLLSVGSALLLATACGGESDGPEAATPAASECCVLRTFCSRCACDPANVAAAHEPDEAQCAAFLGEADWGCEGYRESDAAETCDEGRGVPRLDTPLICGGDDAAASCGCTVGGSLRYREPRLDCGAADITPRGVCCADGNTCECKPAVCVSTDAACTCRITQVSNVVHTSECEAGAFSACCARNDGTCVCSDEECAKDEAPVENCGIAQVGCEASTISVSWCDADTIEGANTVRDEDCGPYAAQPNGACFSSCSSGLQCAAGHVCAAGRCIERECLANDDCAPYQCQLGLCTTSCATRDDCEPGLTCKKGKCGNCVESGDCADQEVCSAGTCQDLTTAGGDRPEGSACDSPEHCQAGLTCCEGAEPGAVCRPEGSECRLGLGKPCTTTASCDVGRCPEYVNWCTNPCTESSECGLGSLGEPLVCAELSDVAGAICRPTCKVKADCARFEEPGLIGEWYCATTKQVDAAGTPIKACVGPI